MTFHRISFPNATRSPALGGTDGPGPSLRGSYAPLPELPAGSILPAGASLKLRNALQTFFDCCAVLAIALVVCLTGVSIPVALYILFFVAL